jgi:hypothetical protein
LSQQAEPSLTEQEKYAQFTYDNFRRVNVEYEPVKYHFFPYLLIAVAVAFLAFVTGLFWQLPILLLPFIVPDVVRTIRTLLTGHSKLFLVPTLRFDDSGNAVRTSFVVTDIGPVNLRDDQKTEDGKLAGVGMYLSYTDVIIPQPLGIRRTWHNWFNKDKQYPYQPADRILWLHEGPIDRTFMVKPSTVGYVFLEFAAPNVIWIDASLYRARPYKEGEKHTPIFQITGDAFAPWKVQTYSGVRAVTSEQLKTIEQNYGAMQAQPLSIALAHISRTDKLRTLYEKDQKRKMYDTLHEVRSWKTDATSENPLNAEKDVMGLKAWLHTKTAVATIIGVPIVLFTIWELFRYGVLH